MARSRETESRRTPGWVLRKGRQTRELETWKDRQIRKQAGTQASAWGRWSEGAVESWIEEAGGGNLGVLFMAHPLPAQGSSKRLHTPARADSMRLEAKIERC